MCQEIGICVHQLRAGGPNPGRRVFAVSFTPFVDATFFATCFKMCMDMIQESSAQTRRQFYMLPLLLYYEFCQLPLSAVVLLWGKYGCIRGVETGVSPPLRIPLIHTYVIEALPRQPPAYTSTVHNVNEPNTTGAKTLVQRVILQAGGQLGQK